MKYLHRIATRLRELTPTPVTFHSPEGSVAEVVRKQALESGTDLVVVTTHARSPLGRFWLGSVVDDLLRKRSLTVHTKIAVEDQPLK